MREARGKVEGSRRAHSKKKRDWWVMVTWRKKRFYVKQRDRQPVITLKEDL